VSEVCGAPTAPTVRGLLVGQGMHLARTLAIAWSCVVGALGTVAAGPPPAVGGNGVVEADDAEPVCGNGTVERGEQCDDGNVTNGDGCSASCTVERAPLRCDDDFDDDTKECEDTEAQVGDRCSSPCRLSTPR